MFDQSSYEDVGGRNAVFLRNLAIRIGFLSSHASIYRTTHTLLHPSHPLKKNKKRRKIEGKI